MSDVSATPPPLPKSRNVVLQVYLIYLLATNGMLLVWMLNALLDVSLTEFVRKFIPNLPDWYFPIITGIAALNVVFAIALFKWKFWGFAGYAFTTVITIGISLLTGVGVRGILATLMTFAMLYGALQVGTDSKGWRQLE